MTEAFADRTTALDRAADIAMDAARDAAAEVMAHTGLGAIPGPHAATSEPLLLKSAQDALRLHNVPRWTRLMLSLAARVSHGSLTITLPDGRAVQARGPHPGPDARLDINTHRLAKRLLLGGNLAVGEAYLDGDFDCPDLAALTEWACRNSDLDSTLMGKPWLRLLRRLGFALAANSRRGSRRNIAYHYDLGNDFYGQWLDPSMTYSAAIWRDTNETLEQAQLNKYRRLAGDVLRIRPDQRVLEIGCGWGGFACLAAREFGARVHAITISREQHDYAQRRVQQAGLTDRVQIELRDYRDLTGQYDAVASIEMIEAVGEKYWPRYFGQLRDRLMPQGRAGIQAIVIADRYFEDYRGTMDFIQAHIFPGGMLLSPGTVQRQAAAAGLQIADTFSFGRDYARTLNLWHQSFEAAWPQIRALDSRKLAFDERFRRMWRYYLAYCEGGFNAGTIDVLQYGFTRS
ncbi:MAG: cyclopropane-fatty-acyl-phospholipid synthase family protein [Ferrovibrio sp.]|uniref:SAM-dependent methyltransferase n=1 Tax=Ferrovibrio sp. TaxID=1917215 RepID=UPI0026276BA0|nr:cyclopropane-fatty-acyl-phospholipid synthase family protein [Ferrovibrio sp.]MCW0233494.1 cyclopropane-fatty-acyl-phospholipid synthase family protein [Ferrovibrio sp.]